MTDNQRIDHYLRFRLDWRQLYRIRNKHLYTVLYSEWLSVMNLAVANGRYAGICDGTDN